MADMWVWLLRCQGLFFKQTWVQLMHGDVTSYSSKAWGCVAKMYGLFDNILGKVKVCETHSTWGVVSMKELLKWVCRTWVGFLKLE